MTKKGLKVGLKRLKITFYGFSGLNRLFLSPIQCKDQDRHRIGLLIMLCLSMRLKRAMRPHNTAWPRDWKCVCVFKQLTLAAKVSVYWNMRFSGSSCQNNFVLVQKPVTVRANANMLIAVVLKFLLTLWKKHSCLHWHSEITKIYTSINVCCLTVVSLERRCRTAMGNVIRKLLLGTLAGKIYEVLSTALYTRGRRAPLHDSLNLSTKEGKQGMSSGICGFFFQRRCQHRFRSSRPVNDTFKLAVVRFSSHSLQFFFSPRPASPRPGQAPENHMPGSLLSSPLPPSQTRPIILLLFQTRPRLWRRKQCGKVNREGCRKERDLEKKVMNNTSVRKYIAHAHFGYILMIL